MTEKKTMFRKLIEAVAEGRSRQAERYIRDYMRSRELGERPQTRDDR